jgi:hypothetical protein
MHWSGYDGIVECVGDDEFVPPGLSYWELSAKKGPRGKADGDYTTRTEGTLDVIRKKAAFVFATPRAWSGRRDWEDEKSSEEKWFCVRALDATRFESWLQIAPGIAAHFGHRYLGRPLCGLWTGEMMWEECSKDVILPSGENLAPSFVIAGREEKRKELAEWLEKEAASEEAKRLFLFGPSAVEMVDFVSATIQTLNSEVKERLASALLWIETEEAAVALDGLASSHIVLAANAIGRCALRLQRKYSCRAILMQEEDREPPIPTDSEEHDRKPGHIHLYRSTMDQRITELLKAGFEPREAAQICETIGSDYVAYRKRAHFFGLAELWGQ